jgi:DNA uptake protein ComE-like DNA-binding protein
MIRRIIGEFFTFSRSERKAVMVLLGLIILVILAKNLIPCLFRPEATDFSVYREEIARFEESIRQGYKDKPDDSGYLTGEVSKTGDPENQHRSIAGGYIEIPAGLVKDRIREDADGIITDGVTYKPVLVNLNTSDSLGLREISGIGPVLSKRIVKYRYLLGGFIHKEQLLEVYGISNENYGQISRQVYIDTVAIKRIDLNTADYETLSRHPYLDDYQVRAIISYRDINGRFRHTGQLLEENLLPEQTYFKVKDYLKAD